MAGRASKLDLQIVSHCGSMNNCLNMLGAEVHIAYAGTLTYQEEPVEQQNLSHIG